MPAPEFVTPDRFDGKVDAMPTSRRLRFEGGTGYQLAMAGAAMRRRWVEMLARFNVTPSQFKVIMSLAEVDSIGQRELAELVGIDPRNCVPIVDSLAESDLLSREMDSKDRRRRVLRLTAEGRRLANELESVNAELEADLLSSLSPAEKAELGRMLATIMGATEAGS
jgi:MarR family transcriptional regulator, temperature-dependent positive regulator of motility